MRFSSKQVHKPATYIHNQKVSIDKDNYGETVKLFSISFVPADSFK